MKTMIRRLPSALLLTTPLWLAALGCGGAPPPATPEGAAPTGTPATLAPTDGAPSAEPLSVAAPQPDEQGDLKGGPLVAEPARGPGPRPSDAVSQAGAGRLPPPPTRVAAIGSGPGELARWLPVDCRTRGYVDVGAVLGSEAPAVSNALEQVAKSTDPTVGSVLRMLRDAGYDPALSLREIAFCDHPDMGLVRLQPSRPSDALALVQKVFGQIGEKPGKVEPWGPLRVLWNPPSDDVLVEVSPTVLLFADEPDDAARVLSATPAGAPPATGAPVLVWLEDREADLAVTDKAGTLEAKVTIHLSRNSKLPRAELDKAAAAIRGDIGKVANGLGKTPFGLLATKLRAAKVVVEEPDVVVRGAITRADLGKLVKTASSLDKKKLDAMMRDLM